MFGSNREKLNKIDRLEKRNVELARQVRDLNFENKVLYKENKELEVKIVDLENNIELLVNNSKNKKIKELVTDGKSEN